MTPEDIADLNRARASLARQRSALSKRIGASELAAASAAEDLMRILLAIEAVDRALTDAGQPYTPPMA
ncbi:hypothetical protein ASF27_10580 [Methylobacterium sp. Leaf102]|jgi:hypothetical protein|uniref:hypothetical protein n=1 Tax=unclassified Methylobacterium TaxID=2615210 RepID=UPI0007022500|nr:MULTISPECIES: hypothetical protein [unclassified Methylobacterium]USU30845.1 hypothetical protein NG677_15960 [Methylobacterium sp. OTU13CASTA1]KQO71369.1 hypothetical protein ASF22_15750 [Methylobacterium sp. Leaf87]KQP24123.1 hypothetical protein ASF25_08395 [Methylobacterium sp. Leaf100]KQP24541.1 hypothetical protein ASF27_10580 [Methylobacterium sp. Leaf102]KQP60339.1 hypothetical protein ASF52_08350 [Methylobacterium sp. Leaf112]